MRDRVAISENCDPCKCNVRARVRAIPSFPPSLSPSWILFCWFSFLTCSCDTHTIAYNRNGRRRSRPNSLDSWCRTFGVITPLYPISTLPLFPPLKKKPAYSLSLLFSRYCEMFFSIRFPQKSTEIEEREREGKSEAKYFIRRCNCFRRGYNSADKKFGWKREKKIYIVTAHSSPVTTVACVSCPSFWRARQASRRLWHGARRRLISRYCRLIELHASVIILFIDRATSLFPETFRRVLHFSYIAVRARLYRDISRRTVLLYLFRYQREREDALFNRHVTP